MIKKTLQLFQPGLLQSWGGLAFKPFFFIVFFVVGLWMLPAPEGLDPKGWHLLILFFATIIGVVLKPLPVGGWALMALTVCVFTDTLSPTQAMGSFGKEVVWLVVFAFFMAKGFIKTGLGSRLAYTFVRIFGKSSLGLSYGLVLTDFLLAPVIPSNTARSGGVLFPIVKSLSEEYGSDPAKGTSRKIGAYLIQCVFQADVVAAAAFLTALASNPLAASIAKSLGVDLTWMLWAKASVVPAVAQLLLIPLFLYVIFPPQVKKTPEAPTIAAEKLKAMGRLAGQEVVMLGTFALLVGLWIFGAQIGVSAASAAMLGVVILLAAGVLTWDDIMDEKGAWTTLIWFAILLGLASNMSTLGVMTWFGAHMQVFVKPFSVWTTALVLVGLLFFCHYFFASSTAHISSLYGVFLVAMLGAGVPGIIAALSLSWASSLSAGLTHFGTGPAPIFFGAGYMSVQKWWTLGALTGLLTLLVWGTIGTAWWYYLGLLG